MSDTLPRCDGPATCLGDSGSGVTLHLHHACTARGVFRIQHALFDGSTHIHSACVAHLQDIAVEPVTLAIWRHNDNYIAGPHWTVTHAEPNAANP